MHPPAPPFSEAPDTDGTATLRHIHLRVGSRSFVGSWGSDSNDTASNLPGPGRALGQLLSAAGRRLEAVVDRTAARAGLSFEGTARRVLMRLCALHAPCPVWARFATTPVVDLAIELSNGHCTGCNQSYISAFSPIDNRDVKDLLRLTYSIEYARSCYAVAASLTLVAEAASLATAQQAQYY
jgi:hypothetical protein